MSASSSAMQASRWRPASARVKSAAPARSRMATVSAISASVGAVFSVQVRQPLAIRRRGVLERVQDRQRLLVARDVRRHLAGLLLQAPDAEQVVVELEGEPKRPAEAPVAGDHGLVVGREQRTGLDRGADQGRGLAPDHVVVQLDGHRLIGRGRGDVDVLALAQHHARLVVEAHQAQDLRIAEAQVRQAVQRHPAEAEDEVAGVDRLRDPVERPQGRAVAALHVAVLDVVVDEAEVVAQLHGRGAGEGTRVVAGDGGVGEQPQERAHPLAAWTVRSVQPEVIADHLVDTGGGCVAVADHPEDLGLRVGEEQVQVDVVADGHGAVECSPIRAKRVRQK